MVNQERQSVQYPMSGGRFRIIEELEADQTIFHLWTFVAKKALSQLEIDHAELLILQAKKRAKAAANKKAKASPSKGPNAGFLASKKMELNKMNKDEIESLVKIGKTVTPQIKDDINERNRRKIMQDEYDREQQLQETAAGRPLTPDEINTLQSDHQAKFIGFGVKQTRAIKDKQELGGRYAIDKKLFFHIVTHAHTNN